MFLEKSAPKKCSKFTGEYPCQSVISIKLQSNFIETTIWDGWSPVNLLHISRTPFNENTSGRLLLNIVSKSLSRFFLNACRLYLCCSPFLSCYGICFFPGSDVSLNLSYLSMYSYGKTHFRNMRRNSLMSPPKNLYLFF